MRFPEILIQNVKKNVSIQSLELSTTLSLVYNTASQVKVIFWKYSAAILWVYFDTM